MPIVPVFSGEDYGKKQIMILLDQNKDDPEKAAAVKAAFGENLLDANNGEHAEQVTQNLQEKIIERYLQQPAEAVDHRSKVKKNQVAPARDEAQF